ASYAGDADYNGPAQVTLGVTDLFNGTVATGSGAATSDSKTVDVTITPSPEVSVSVTGSPVSEGGAGSLSYVFSRTGGTGTDLTVSFTGAGTAGLGPDYTLSGASRDGGNVYSVVIGKGQASATVTVTPKDDAVIEGDETVVLTVTDGRLYDLGSPAA